MNKEIKQKWIEALRSGEYKQGTGYLQGKDGKFCCLGVLCDLAVKHNIIPEPRICDRCSLYCGNEASGLPDEVLEWAGLTESLGEVVNICDIRVSLYAHNDNGITFEEIAKAIDEQL